MHTGGHCAGILLEMWQSTADRTPISRVNRLPHMGIPYRGYFSGGKIFVSSEFLASLWKYFRGRRILNHTRVLCGTVSWIINFMVRLNKKNTKILPSKKYPLYGTWSYMWYCYSCHQFIHLLSSSDIPTSITSCGEKSTRVGNVRAVRFSSTLSVFSLPTSSSRSGRETLSISLLLKVALSFTGSKDGTTNCWSRRPDGVGNASSIHK